MKKPRKIKMRREMNDDHLRNLAQQVVEKLRPLRNGTPIRLNRNFANNTFKIWTDKRSNGWWVLIGSVTDWEHSKFIISLNDYVGRNKKQFQYCVEFRDENIMDRFLQRIDHEKMFGEVVFTIRDKDIKTVNGIDKLKVKLPRKCYGKPMKELSTTSQSTWFYYFIHDSSENVNNDLIDRIVGFYASIGKALSENNDIAVENRQKRTEHISRERCSGLALLRKQEDDYQCQICEMKFEDVYGEIGKDFAEAHHIVPLAKLQGPQKVSVNDLITVCANCHRMLDKLQGEAEDIDELKDMLLMRYEVR